MNHLKNSSFESQAKTYRNKYMNQFISLKCSADMLAWRLFPNAKEITESFACYEATKHLPVNLGDKIVVIVVGDGHTPRTAATFAMRSRWDTYSVDPNLTRKWPDLRRVNVCQGEIERWNFSFDRTTIIVLPHAHVLVDTCLKQIQAPERHVISLQCCVKHNLEIPPCLEYRDSNVWSPENLIKIWRNV